MNEERRVLKERSVKVTLLRRREEACVRRKKELLNVSVVGEDNGEKTEFVAFNDADPRM